MNYSAFLLFIFFFSLNFSAHADLLSTLDTSNLPIAELDTESMDEIPFNNYSDLSVAARDPDYRIIDFYKRRKPAFEVKVPTPTDRERIMWKVGETIRDIKIPIGEYSIIRIREKSDGFYIRYVAKAKSNGLHLRIFQTTNEIMPGDSIVKENFDPRNIPDVDENKDTREKSRLPLGKVSAFFEPEQDLEISSGGTKHLLGAKFKEYKGGHSVSIGAKLVIRRRGDEIARAIVVDADLDLATLYIYQTKREVQHNDQIYEM